MIIIDTVLLNTYYEQANNSGNRYFDEMNARHVNHCYCKNTGKYYSRDSNSIKSVLPAKMDK